LRRGGDGKGGRGGGGGGGGGSESGAGTDTYAGLGRAGMELATRAQVLQGAAK